MFNFLARLGAGIQDRTGDFWFQLKYFLHHNKVVHPFREGRWLARLMDNCWPAWLTHADADGIPSYPYMRWNTRSAEARFRPVNDPDYYWSESGRAGVVPCVESWLRRYDVVTWFGRRYTIWMLEVTIQVFVRDDPVTFQRTWYGVNEDLLRTMFVKYQAELRDTLKGESQSVIDLRRQHGHA